MVLKKDREDNLVQLREKGRGIIWSERGEEYKAYYDKKEGHLNWSNLA